MPLIPNIRTLYLIAQSHVLVHVVDRHRVGGELMVPILMVFVSASINESEFIILPIFVRIRRSIMRYHLHSYKHRDLVVCRVGRWRFVKFSFIKRFRCHYPAGEANGKRS